MNGSEQAERAAQTAAVVLEAQRLDLDPRGADLDRRDLARLLAAIAKAWNSAEKATAVSMNERLRWSASCAIANRIAERWESEALLADHSAAIESADSPDTSAVILAFPRDVNGRVG